MFPSTAILRSPLTAVEHSFLAGETISSSVAPAVRFAIACTRVSGRVHQDPRTIETEVNGN